jgi:hypothetical protein
VSSPILEPAVPSAPTVPDAAFRARVSQVLERTFVAASLGMPTEDARTAMDVLWSSYEALVGRHFPAPGSPPGTEVPDATHWSRILVTAVTNSIVLGGGFVRPAKAEADVLVWADRLRSGGAWHTRRPPGPGAVVLAAHVRLLALDEVARTGRPPGPSDQGHVDGLVALAGLGAVLGTDDRVPRPVTTPPETVAARRRRAGEAAAAYGVPDVELVAAERTGWACASCGCLFTGGTDGAVVYPDRMAPVGRGGPCDAVTECACHAAPLRRASQERGGQPSSGSASPSA